MRDYYNGASYSKQAWFQLSINPASSEIQLRAFEWDIASTNDNLSSDQIFIHRISDLRTLKKSYQDQGWNTDVLLQSPSHKGPTAARPIGFPFNFITFAPPLSRWGNVIVLRLHVDIIYYKEQLASWPHIEPDPKYEPEKHLEMYLASNEIRGEPVVNIFGQFYHD